MLIIVAVGLFLGGLRGANQSGVLAYATEISSKELLVSTNEKRKQNGKPELKMNELLSEAAQAKANDMAMRNYWSHYTPEGDAPWVFVDKVGYDYAKAGENLAYGFKTSRETVTGWMNSQTHRDNMLDEAFSEVGFGFANAKDFNKSGNETIVVAMYGQPKTEDLALVNKAEKALAPYSTGVSRDGEPSTTAISWVQSITNGTAPWVTFIIGFFSGMLLLFMCIKHGLAFKRVLVEGEHFVLKHPAIDITIVALLMLGYILSQTTGFIR